MCGGVCDMIGVLRFIVGFGIAISLMEVLKRLALCIMLMRLRRSNKEIKRLEEVLKIEEEAIRKLKDK